MARVLKRVASDLHRLIDGNSNNRHTFEQKLIISIPDNQMSFQLIITYQFNTLTGIKTTERIINDPKLTKGILKFPKNVWKRIVFDGTEYSIRKNTNTTGEIFLGYYKGMKQPNELKGVYVNKFRLEALSLIRSKSEGSF